MKRFNKACFAIAEWVFDRVAGLVVLICMLCASVGLVMLVYFLFFAAHQLVTK